MSTITEIETAIEHLPAAQVEELASWLDTLRTRISTTTTVESWLAQARGVARPEITTADVMKSTRGEG